MPPTPHRRGRPTIYDVARAAGVSKSLVSLVLQGSPKVSEQSRRAVEQAIAELGYRPSRAASNLAAGRTRLVGVLIDDYTNLWFVDLVRGLHAALGPRGYRLSVADIATADQAEHPVESFLSTRVDGIVVGMDPPDGLWSGKVPPVVVAGTRELSPPHAGSPFASVANDDAAGARLVAGHLAGLGHRIVGHVAVAGGAGTARRTAFTDEMQALGGTVHVTASVGPASDELGHAGAIELLAAHPGITAVFAANDVIAVGVLAAARDLGLRVPDDLSVVGYDDSPLAAARLIGLTTVDDRGFDVGAAAGRLLADRMEGRIIEPTATVLPPTLTIRGTTGPVRTT